MVVAATAPASAPVTWPAWSGASASAASRRPRYPNADSAAHDCNTLWIAFRLAMVFAAGWLDDDLRALVLERGHPTLGPRHNSL
jgi:hypothetical protein